MSKETALPPSITEEIDTLVATTRPKGFTSEQLATGLLPFLRTHPQAVRRLGISDEHEALLHLAAIIAVDEWRRTHVENWWVGPSLMTRFLRWRRWPKRSAGDFDEDD